MVYVVAVVIAAIIVSAIWAAVLFLLGVLAKYLRRKYADSEVTEDPKVPKAQVVATLAMTAFILLGVVGWRLLLPGYPLTVRVLLCALYVLFGLIGVRMADAYAKKRGLTFVWFF